jgi:hypothetical protein
MTRTPLSKCLNCGYPIDAASAMDKEKGLLDNIVPKEGDISICMKCSHMMAFRKNGQLRPLTDQEMLKIAGDPRILLLQKALGEMRIKNQWGEQPKKKE